MPVNFFEGSNAEKVAASLETIADHLENLGSPEAIAEDVAAWMDEHITENPTVVIDDSLSIRGAAADAKKTGDEISDLKSHHNLQIDSIPGTEQTILFDDEGNVRSITHSANGTAVRTDMFTFGDDTIIEVRTLASGEIMTIMINTDTLVTTVAYTPAE